MTSPASSPPPRSDLTLALNGAEDRLQLALGRGDELLLSQEWVVPGRAMQHLAPALVFLLEQLELRPTDIQKIACVRGPGSFTGLRLVLATALGLAEGLDIPMAGLDYLPLLAAGPAGLVQGAVWVLTHARRGQVHVQGFAAPAHPGLLPDPLGPATAATLDEAARLVAAGPQPRHALGSGLRRNLEALEPLLGDARILAPSWDHPAPRLLLAAADRAEYGRTPVQPLYLRPSDAEENLESIARNRGLDPDEARERLDRLTSS